MWSIVFIGIYGCLVWWNFNSWHYLQSFKSDSFIPALLIGTIHHYHFMIFQWPWLRVTKSVECKICWVCFLHALLNLLELNFAWCWSSLSLISWHHFWRRFSLSREITVALLMAWKKSKQPKTKTKMGMRSEIYQLILLKLRTRDTTEGNILILIIVSLTFIQGHRSAGKQRTLHQLFLRVLDQFAWNVAWWWVLKIWWHLYSFYLVQYVFRGKNPPWVI